MTNRELIIILLQGYNLDSQVNLDIIEEIVNGRTSSKSSTQSNESKVQEDKLPPLSKSKLQGLCRTCSRRKKCPKARWYEDVTECLAYKISAHRKRFD